MNKITTEDIIEKQTIDDIEKFKDTINKLNKELTKLRYNLNESILRSELNKQFEPFFKRILNKVNNTLNKPSNRL